MSTPVALAVATSEKKVSDKFVKDMENFFIKENNGGYYLRKCIFFLIFDHWNWDLSDIYNSAIQNGFNNTKQRKANGEKFIEWVKNYETGLDIISQQMANPNCYVNHNYKFPEQKPTETSLSKFSLRDVCVKIVSVDKSPFGIITSQLYNRYPQDPSINSLISENGNDIPFKLVEWVINNSKDQECSILPSVRSVVASVVKTIGDGGW